MPSLIITSHPISYELIEITFKDGTPDVKNHDDTSFYLSGMVLIRYVAWWQRDERKQREVV